MMESIVNNAAPLPTTEELMQYLIAEDLKSRRFFDGLRELGLDDAWNRPTWANSFSPMHGLIPTAMKYLIFIIF